MRVVVAAGYAQSSQWWSFGADRGRLGMLSDPPNSPMIDAGVGLQIFSVGL